MTSESSLRFTIEVNIGHFPSNRNISDFCPADTLWWSHCKHAIRHNTSTKRVYSMNHCMYRTFKVNGTNPQLVNKVGLCNCQDISVKWSHLSKQKLNHDSGATRRSYQRLIPQWDSYTRKSASSIRALVVKDSSHRTCQTYFASYGVSKGHLSHIYRYLKLFTDIGKWITDIGE